MTTFRTVSPNCYSRRAKRVMALAAIAFTIAAITVAPSATADSTDSLRAAVVAVRGSACGPLRSTPVVDEAAAAINATTDKWINHTARAVPETDALPLLKDLGFNGSKSAILSGAGSSDSKSITALLLQGFAKLPDCSYTDFGVNAMYNTTKDLVLTTVVLAA